MWNAASTSACRATWSVVVAALVLVTLVIAASGGAAPKPPRDLQITRATETTLSLVWAPARAHGERTIIGYHVYRDGLRQKTPSGDELVPDTSFEFNSLRCGLTYSLGVEAVDDSGAASDVGVVMASTSPCPDAPSPPTGTSAPSTPAPSTAPSAPAASDPADETVQVPVSTATVADGAVAFTAVADARVDEARPDVNYGSRKVLRVAGGSGSGMQSYLRFDVNGVSGPVASAKLRVYATTGTADGPAVYGTASTWSESGITWNGRPPIVGSAADDVGVIAPGNWVEWDVTKLVSSSGSYSFVLIGQSSDGFAMSSREGGAAAQLVVSADPGTTGGGGDTTPPGAPTQLALVSRSVSDVTVSWSASTDDVGVAGYDLLVNGTKTGETTSLKASLGGLACGQSYTIGVRAFDAAGNRSLLASLSAATLACTQPPPGGGGVNWFPGYYVLAHGSANHQQILDDPLVTPFTGVQFRYFWSDSEAAPHDYAAGFAALDADLKAVASKGKKLLVMLQYKKNDGSPAVPSDLLKGPGPWCSGSYCGELVGSTSHLAMVWNAAVDARLQAWISAMATHAAASPYASSVAGIVFNETALGTTDTTILRAAGYDPYAYMKGLQANMLAATSAAPRLPVLYYHEGGFISMDGQSVHAGEAMGNWMLQHPHTGMGTPDLKPKSPKGPAHPCAIASFQGLLPCAPAVEAPDYSTSITDSLDQTYKYAVSSAPDGLHASFLTFVYTPGSGPNAFTFADVSRYIPSHPIPNTALPPGW